MLRDRPRSMTQNELLKLIDQAADEGWTELDLASKNLTELPGAICQLSSLKSLNLQSNQLSALPEEICQLENIQSLSLGKNQLSALPEGICQLNNLKSLNLQSNQLSALPEGICQLKNLKSLNLQSNQLSTLPKGIGQLSNLKSLNLGNNQLSALPERIGQLKNLKSLSLGNNQLSALPEWIGQLNNLKSLDFHSNQLSALPEWIGQLSKLQSLNLGSNQLSALPGWIRQLSNLQSLDLRSNQLSALPEEIGQLCNLKSLSLGSNQLSALPEGIGQLNNLQSLNLQSNQLPALPEGIGQLNNLQYLNLGNNRLPALLEWIGQLNNLQYLGLGNNQLSALPEWIGQLNNLKSIDFHSNQLSALPEWIGQLNNLEYLNLGNNQLSALPEWVGQLKNLQYLSLHGNQLSALPRWFATLATLGQLSLAGNPLPIPPEILANPSNVSAIFDYYFQTLDPNETEPLYEAKFIIVGEGGAGKTTLAKKLLDPEYELAQNEESTEGIDVMRWEFPPPNGQPFRINLWDFGGQEIYHATHQFFLTKRSLYALVVDTRQNNTDLHYWLKVVELLSDNSPVFLIKNEKQDRQCDVNERQWRGEFTNLERFFSTNLATNRGLETVQAAIQQRITQLDHIGTPLPKVWVRVRAALENYAQTCNTISLEKYFELCRISQLTDKQRMLNLSQYLHDLGVILHFQDDPILKNTVILRPEWGTAAVYQVLDTPEVCDNLGRFNHKQLKDVWGNSEYADLQDQLLQLMRRFKLCYLIPGTEEQYIAPHLLSPDDPYYDWDTTGNLILRYRYEFMPKGILTRFIVEMHRFIEEQRLVWKSGVILTNGSARAEVTEIYHKGEIHVRVGGTLPRDLLNVITHEIDQINASYERIQVDKQIPCNCDLCITTEHPHFFPLDILKRSLGEAAKVQCPESFKMVDSQQLIHCIGAPITDDRAQGDVEAAEPAGLHRQIEAQKEAWPTQVLDPTKRRKLFRTLSTITIDNFEELVFALSVPRSTLGGKSAPQVERVSDLLGWAESPGGCGLGQVENLVNEILGSA